MAAVTVFCLMHPKPAMAQELRESLLSLVEPTHEETGCIAYDVYEEQDGSLVLFETWQSQADLEMHQQQPAIKELFGNKLTDILDDELDVHFTRLISATK